MKKISNILSLLAVAAFALLLAACTKSSTEAPQNTTTKEAEVTTTKEAEITTTEEAPVTTTEDLPPVTQTDEPHTVHVWGDEFEYDEDGHWKVCTICDEESAVEDHEFINQETTKATDTVEGVITHTCEICGYSYQENTGLAFVWKVEDDAYITDFASKQSDSHFDISYSEDGNTVHLISSEDYNWNALIAYASGSTEGYGMEITVSVDEGLTNNAQFVIKPNNVEPSWIWNVYAEPGTSKTFYYAHNDIPTEMESMVVMLNNPERNGHLSIKWVKLSYEDGFVFNSNTGKVDQVKVCTTHGFEKYKTTVESYKLEEVTVKDAAQSIEYGLQAKTPVILSGKVSGVTDEDTVGKIVLTATVDGTEYNMTTTEIAKLGTLFSYELVGNESEGYDLIASAKSVANFKELGIKNGDTITVLGIILSENEELHAYGELLSIEPDASQVLPEGVAVAFTGFGTGSESVYPSTGVTLDDGKEIRAVQSLLVLFHLLHGHNGVELNSQLSQQTLMLYHSL